MSTSLLFYSNYCQHSKIIVKEISNTALRDSMKYVCIDSKDVRKKLPNYINNVPSLVVGKTNQILVGDQILSWIKMNPIVNQNQQTNQQNNQQNNEQKTNPENNLDPKAWHLNEMNAFSDMYSFLNIDTSTKGDGGLSMKHSFESINDNEQLIGHGQMPGGAPARQSIPVEYQNPMKSSFNNEGFGSIQMSEKSDILNKQMEEMMNRRELDVPNKAGRI